MTTLTLEQVRSIVDFAFAGPRVHPSVRLAVAVVDASVALLGRSNHAVVYTTDPDDLRHLGAEVVAI